MLIHTVVVLLVVSATAYSTEAAFVTLKEPEMDAIYSQVSFAPNPVDIVYLSPTIVVNNPSLLNINSAAKEATLFALFDSSTTHYAYYVDTISTCGATSDPAIVGCGDLPGDDYVVESTFAAGLTGAETMAHELGHNLGLEHDPEPPADNLVDPTINGVTTLTPVQVAVIFGGSRQPQFNGLNYFVEIQPVLIVPEPATSGLVGLAFLVLASTFRSSSSVSKSA